MNELWLVAMHVAVITIASACVLLVEGMLRAARPTRETGSRAARKLPAALPLWSPWWLVASGNCESAAGRGVHRRSPSLATSLRQAADLPVMPGRTAPWLRLAEVAARPEFRQRYSPRQLPREG